MINLTHTIEIDGKTLRETFNAMANTPHISAAIIAYTTPLKWSEEFVIKKIEVQRKHFFCHQNRTEYGYFVSDIQIEQGSKIQKPGETFL